ncbi:unnamed protein product [Paramecium primaurelia]|uniref:Uncharacterized protein n=1 Tax=Paramecium primaurelia TaxID=5886 RepID=A0A8S1KVQ5_PARPR|nr:unnamed protein product [Paramecium primaurelia]
MRTNLNYIDKIEILFRSIIVICLIKNQLIEYQLELANKTIQELQQKLLATNKQIVSKQTEKISKIELYEKQIERINNEITILYRKLESFEHELRIKTKDDQYYKCETYIERLEQQLRDTYYQIDDQNIYLLQIEQRITPLMKQTISLLNKIRVYYKKTIQNQINKLKVEYELKIFEQQDKQIQLNQSRNKEGFYFIKQFIH